MKSRDEKWLLEIKYRGQKNEAFFQDLKKLKEGWPLDYLIGWSDFLNTKIDLSFKPLIPRTETEFWISEYLFPVLKKKKDGLKILDLFAGSGAIGIGVYKHFQEKINFLDFGEIEEGLILQIKKNIKINFQKKIGEFYQSDCLKNIPIKKYNFILANPPYLDYDKKEMVQKSVLNFEKESYLFADQKGLEYLFKLVLKAKNFLVPEGELWIEFDHWQKDLIEDFLNQNNFNKYYFYQDQFKRWRVLRLVY